MYASKNGHVQVVDVLINNNAALDIQSNVRFHHNVYIYVCICSMHICRHIYTYAICMYVYVTVSV